MNQLEHGPQALARYVEFDRDRALYPTVVIVIASYYVLFAAMSGSVHTVLLDPAADLADAAVRASEAARWPIIWRAARRHWRRLPLGRGYRRV